MNEAELKILVGVDTGGTFTDFVVARGRELLVHKELSTPDDPARAVLAGLQHLLKDTKAGVIHGSTVATNALLERRGARTALVTTSGFEDVLEIARQIRRSIYDLNVSKEPPLVSTDHCVGVVERVGPHGEVLVPLTDGAIETAVRHILDLDVESVAICLLHSYANPKHEQRLAEALRRQFSGFVTASYEVLPEFREYERSSTTAVNAFVGPIMGAYLDRLGATIGPSNIRIMQSNGGSIALRTARDFAVQTILSGPAGGAVGGFEMGRRAGYDHVITFDMGGTSTDVCLCPGEIARTPDAMVGDLPVRVPVIDIHTVGAGGGSIAYRDPGGSLRVGPRSAGAAPGPICYGRGGHDVTVTDANLFLGRLSVDHFLGGTQALVRPPVEEAIKRFAHEMQLTPVEAAEGIIRVANAIMERAVRVISLERGFDPRDFSLVCFGGAGGMHASELAGSLGIPRVIVPRAAGILSAVGMLLADFVRDYSRTWLTSVGAIGPAALDEAFEPLVAQASQDIATEGFNPNTVVVERSLDMRYVGQGYELNIPMVEDMAEVFHQVHEKRYGYSDPKRDVEVVTLRVRVTGTIAKPEMPSIASDGRGVDDARIDDCDITFAGRTHRAPLFDREQLQPTQKFAGPALVVEYSTTTVVPPDWRCRVDEWGNLILERIET